MAHPMADKTMTRAEMLTMVRDHFTRLDENKDGVITTAEVSDSRAKWSEHRKEMGGGPGGGWHGAPMGDPSAAFDRLDTNKDGSISRDEFAKGHEQRDRAPHRHEREAQGCGQGRQARTGTEWADMGGAQMIVMADTNKDGKITEAEAEAMALQHFDQMDTNHDGQVTPEERRAGRSKMMKQMHADKTTG